MCDHILTFENFCRSDLKTEFLSNPKLFSSPSAFSRPHCVFVYLPWTFFWINLCVCRQGARAKHQRLIWIFLSGAICWSLLFLLYILILFPSGAIWSSLQFFLFILILVIFCFSKYRGAAITFICEFLKFSFCNNAARDVMSTLPAPLLSFSSSFHLGYWSAHADGHLAQQYFLEFSVSFSKNVFIIRVLVYICRQFICPCERSLPICIISNLQDSTENLMKLSKWNSLVNQKAICCLKYVIRATD